MREVLKVRQYSYRYIDRINLRGEKVFSKKLVVGCGISITLNYEITKILLPKTVEG